MALSDVHPTLVTYHKTLRGGTAANLSVIGVFDEDSKSQQVVRAAGTYIELWRFQKSTASLSRIINQNTYGYIRSISVLRPIGVSHDFLILVSDSGNITLCKLNMNEMRFMPIVNEPFAKSGIRRLTPGQYLAVNSETGTICLSAIEQNKLVYTINRKESDLLLSSPLESNRSQIITYHMISLDVGYDNPLFAAIEVDYSTKSFQSQKMLNYYELDVGLNYVIRKGSINIESTASMLIAVPGGDNGPSGTIVCSKGMLEYRSPMATDAVIAVNLPKRDIIGSEESEIICSVVHQMKDSFFILVQNQYGDIFRVTLEYKATQESLASFMSNLTGSELVSDITIRYFDTIPPCSQLLIFKSGFLYANSEIGDQYIYQFEKLGDDGGIMEWNSTSMSPSFKLQTLENLSMVNIIDSLSPLLGLEIDSNAKDITKISKLIASCGTQSRATVKLVSNEIKIETIVSQELPSEPRNVWTVKMNASSKTDDFIVLSFDNSTVALKIGDEVEEAENDETGLKGETSSLLVTNIGNSVVQVHSIGFRQITFDQEKVSKIVNWDVPCGLEVLHVSATSSQLLLALSNGELVYFEQNVSDNQSLNEFTKRKSYIFQITSITLGAISKDGIRSSYLIVATKDQKLEILSTLPKKTFDVLSSQDMVNVVSSLCVTMDNDLPLTKEEIESDINSHSHPNPHLHVGFENGLYSRYQITNIGEMLNIQNKYVGPEKITFSKIKIDGKCFIGIKNVRTWLSYPTKSLELRPLPKPEAVTDEEINEESDEGMNFSNGFTSICNINSEDIDSGLLLIHDSNLIIANKPNVESRDNIQSIPIRYTPKGMSYSNDETSMIYVICSDKIESPFTKHLKLDKTEDQYIYPANGIIGEEQDSDVCDVAELESEFEKAQQFSYESSENWSSCVHAISSLELKIVQTIELLGNESAQRIELIPITKDTETSNYLFVSTVKDFNMMPRKYSSCFVRVYRILENGSIEYVYKHEMASPVLAMSAFQGKALLGWGNELGLFELGQKQLIRKSGHLFSPNIREIVGLEAMGNRIVVSDINNSVKIIVFKSVVNTFFEIADDIISKHVTKSIMLDYDTIMVADKFGTVSIVRVSHDTSELSDIDFDGTLLKIKEDKFNGAIDRLEPVMSFYIGDVVTGLKKCKIGLSSEDIIVYSAMSGTIGSFSALKTLREVNFYNDLSTSIKAELNFLKWNLTERNIDKFRSYYVPIKSCIDGDLIAMFKTLPRKAQMAISEKMELSVDQIENRIMDVQNRIGM